jgi:hypothetical protein
VVNVDYLNVAVNNISTSIGSLGQFGYNTRNQQEGVGVTYNDGLSQLFEGGLMIGTNEGGFIRVVDRIRNGNNRWDDDFQSEQNIKEETPPAKGDYYVSGIFNDSNANADTIGLRIGYNVYASKDVGHEDYIIMEYIIENISNQKISNLHAGLFADFDVVDGDKNACKTDLKRFMTYTESTSITAGKPVFGVQLLNSNKFKSYCLDNVDGGLGGVDIYNGYNNSKKYETLTSNRYSSGPQDVSGGDVIQSTGVGGFSLLPNDTFKVAFALMAAENISVLNQVADSSYKRYNGRLPNSVKQISVEEGGIKVYPNPVEQLLTLTLENKTGDVRSYRILNNIGQEVSFGKLSASLPTVIDVSQLYNGLYFVEVNTQKRIFVTKFIKNQ